MTSYIALIRKDRASDYGVEFPDFPGCVTAGVTLDDARRMASEALQFHTDGMAEDHEPIPPPSTLDAVMGDPGSTGAVAVLVDVPTPATKAVRINVMLPQDLVQAIDRTTRNRSRFLADAAREKLRA